jgi:hypothetical protein
MLGGLRVARVRARGSGSQGAHFTCFTSTKVQTLAGSGTLKAEVLEFRDARDASLLSLLALVQKQYKY